MKFLLLRIDELYDTVEHTSLRNLGKIYNSKTDVVPSSVPPVFASVPYNPGWGAHLGAGLPHRL